jgi:hypothetical protein
MAFSRSLKELELEWSSISVVLASGMPARLAQAMLAAFQ